MSEDDNRPDSADDEQEGSRGADEQPQPWAKASPSTESLAADDDEDD